MQMPAKTCLWPIQQSTVDSRQSRQTRVQIKLICELRVSMVLSGIRRRHSLTHWPIFELQTLPPKVYWRYRDANKKKKEKKEKRKWKIRKTKNKRKIKRLPFLTGSGNSGEIHIQTEFRILLRRMPKRDKNNFMHSNASAHSMTAFI